MAKAGGHGPPDLVRKPGSTAVELRPRGPDLVRKVTTAAGVMEPSGPSCPPDLMRTPGSSVETVGPRSMVRWNSVFRHIQRLTKMMSQGPPNLLRPLRPLRVQFEGVNTSQTRGEEEADPEGF